MKIWEKLAALTAQVNNLVSLNEQKDAVISRLNDECEIHAENNVELRNTVQRKDESVKFWRAKNNEKSDIMVRLYRAKKDAEYFADIRAKEITRLMGDISSREIAIGEYCRELTEKRDVISELEIQNDKHLEKIWYQTRDIDAYQIQMNHDMRVITRLIRRSENRYRIIQLLKSKMSRMEKRIQTWQEVAKQYEEIAEYWKTQNAASEGIMRSYGRTISQQDEEIRELKEKIDAMNSAVETEDYEITCGPEIVLDFTHHPEIVGYAPCGNGCPIKIDSTGRAYDAHEKMCEESDEFTGIEL